jgi:hypothetical protein
MAVPNLLARFLRCTLKRHTRDRAVCFKLQPKVSVSIKMAELFAGLRIKEECPEPSLCVKVNSCFKYDFFFAGNIPAACPGAGADYLRVPDLIAGILCKREF